MISYRAPTTRCPVCGATCRTIKTTQITATYREITYVCGNDDCQMMFVASITPVRVIEQSRLQPIVAIPTHPQPGAMQ